MKIEIPFSVEYGVENAVPLEDVIDTLVALKSILGDAAEALGDFSPNLSIEGSYVLVRSVSQESPLKEIFLVALFVAFQEDIESAVSDAYTAMTGEQLAAHMETLFALTAMMVIYYGIGAAKDLAMKSVSDGPSKKLIKRLSEDLGQALNVSPKTIRASLEKRYSKQGKIGALTKNVLKFFKPAKSQGGAQVWINKSPVPHEALEELPEAQASNVEVPDKKYRDYENVEIELHAKDRDRVKSGWAATCEEISPRRLPLKLFDGVQPQQIWDRDTVKANVTLVLEQDGANLVPVELHLRALLD